MIPDKMLYTINLYKNIFSEDITFLIVLLLYYIYFYVIYIKVFLSSIRYYYVRWMNTIIIIIIM